MSCGNPNPDDPHVVKDGKELPDDPKVLSPPIIPEPLYDCAAAVIVQGFEPDSKIQILADGAPIGGGNGNAPWGQSFGVAPKLTPNQVITATQSKNGTTSAPSKPVTVRSHTKDFPNGLLTPFIDPLPLYKCGKATAVRNIVPGGALQVFSEPPLSAGGLGPPVVVGHENSAGSAQAVLIAPEFVEGARITAQYSLCSDKSPVSSAQIVQPNPPVISAPNVDPNIYDGARFVTVLNVLNGAVIDVQANGNHIGGQASSGGGQIVSIAPPAISGQTVKAFQALCSGSPGSPGVTVLPCSKLPPAKISPPQVGDDVIHVTDFILGSRILIYANGQEIGNGGGPLVQLTRPLVSGEQVKVLQILGNCRSSWIYVINVECKVPAAISNPSGSGPYSVGKLDYKLPAISIGGDTARMWATVRYPALADGNNAAMIPSPTRLPLVVFLHGNHGVFRKDGDDFCADPGGATETPNHEGYDYVLDSLAKGGFIAISINANDLNCLGDRIPERAQLVLAHLGLWKKLNDGGQPDPVFNGKFHNRVDLGEIALAGHSRGGEAVVGAALMNNDVALKIRAVLCIAPTDAHSWTLADDQLLMLVGAADGDVSDNSGVRIYDRAQQKSSDAWFKSQMYIYGANHNFFNTEWLKDEGKGPNRMIRSGQEAMLSAWARTFFHLTLQGTETYRPIFSGDSTVTAIENDRVFPSYQRTKATIVDDFEENPPTVNKNKLLGGVTHTVNFPVFDVFELRQGGAHVFNGTFFHDTSGLVASWSAEMPSFREEIPPAQADVSSFEYLSFRVAQVNDSTNSANNTMNFRVGLEDGNGSRIDIDVVSAGVIPFPYAHPLGAKSMMRTIRIPLACFALNGKKPLQMKKITAIDFTFDKLPKGTLAFDQIEFAH
jgi:hypothetical protein